MYAIEGSMVWLVWPVVAGLVVFLEVRRRAGLWHTLGVLALATYALWIASVAFFPLYMGDTGEPHFDWEGRWGLINLVPFHSLIDSFRYPDAPRLLRMHGGNFLLLAPYTLLGPVLWAWLRKWWKALVLGLVLSAGIELLQLALRSVAEPPYRSADFDDVMLNTAGALFGYGLYLLARRLARRIRRLDASSEPYNPLGNI